VNAVRRLVERLGRLAAKPAQPSPGSYREAPADTSAAALRDLQTFMALQAVRIRVLERQLAAQGHAPAATPTIHEFRKIVDLLEALARCKGHQLNTLELESLADCVSGLADWGLDEP